MRGIQKVKEHDRLAAAMDIHRNFIAADAKYQINLSASQLEVINAKVRRDCNAAGSQATRRMQVAQANASSPPSKHIFDEAEAGATLTYCAFSTIALRLSVTLGLVARNDFARFVDTEAYRVCVRVVRAFQSVRAAQAAALKVRA